MTTATEKGQETESEPGLYLTKAEVARRLRKSQRTVDNWQRRGILPYMKLGRSVLFKWDDVERHLEQNFRICGSPAAPSANRPASGEHHRR